MTTTHAPTDHAATKAAAATEELHFFVAEDHGHAEGGTMLGFWIYLMSDCLIFAALFAVYAVLGRNFAAGPSPADLFDLPVVAINTSMLLLSSITYGFAMLRMEQQDRRGTLLWMAVTALFGMAFVGLELNEFAHLIQDGAGPGRSAFLSAFFTLVGTHGLHVTVGIVWMITLMVQVASRGLGPENQAPSHVP